MGGNGQWERMVEITKAGVERRDSALLWGVDVAKCLHQSGSHIPSIHLGTILVTYLCTHSNNNSSSFLIWSYLDHAMATHLVSSFHVLALLTSRLVPYRLQYPEMYSVYINLASTYVFNIGYTKPMPCCERVIKAVNEALQLSLCGMQAVELGTAVVHFLFSLVWRLVDASSEDWGLPPSRQVAGSSQVLQSQTAQETAIELDDERSEKREQLRRNNSIGAIELVAKIMQNKRTAALLRLAQRHLSDQWKIFAQRLQLLETLALDASTTAPKAALEALQKLSGSLQGLSQVWRPSQLAVMKALVETSSRTSSFGNCSGLGRSAVWLPFDIFMEDAMDVRRVPSRPIVEELAEMVKSLQAVQDVSWHDTFLALWLSGLRLVQREREPVEGPKTHIESRLCMLLSIVPSAALMLIEDEEKHVMGSKVSSENSCVGAADDKEQSFGTRRTAFISSLQILGQFEGLLSPPQYVAMAAQQAAAAAGAFLAGVGSASTGYEGLSAADANSGLKAAGNLRHLIIETCIARGLLDTSAYVWSGSTGHSGGSQPISSHNSPWSAFMDGAPLAGVLKSSLMTTPARSVAELEKIYQCAINGQEEERVAAGSIVCGASLLRGWNVQEHVVHVIIRLLSPPASPGSQSNSHFISHAPMFLAVLNGLISIDAVHIMSLYGMFPELAAALLPICEFFGSLPPAVSLTTGSGEDVPVLLLFSLAFLLLVKLWKFHRPPLEHRLLGLGAPLGSDCTLECLLYRYNIQTSSSMGNLVEKADKDDQKALTNVYSLTVSLPHGPKAQVSGSTSHSITLDSFPRLKAWYLQHQACIASPLSGLVRGDPMHQVTDRLLSMMMGKVGKGAPAPTTPSTSGNTITGEDAGGRLLLPAWDLLAAVPFVVDAVLTACGYGKLSPRDLITGLRDLVDFLPASLATIVSYFAAEVTRGLWKPASMNGTDWPNPAANLFSLDAELRDMLAATGVTAPSTGLASGNAPVTLPLPLAAFVSLTITYKGEKLSDAVLGVCGPALESAAGSIPWPSMGIVGALWAQKIRKWHDFILFSSSQTIFKQDKNAVIQLLRSCFSVTLGSSSTASKLRVYGGVGALLGHGNWSRLAPGGRHPVSPGLLYLRSYPALHDIMFVCEEILTLVVKAARDLAAMGADAETFGGPIKHVSRLRCACPSLPTTVARLTQASTLGASLLWISGGTSLVQLLYTEILLTLFLSGGKAQDNSSSCKRGSSALFEGYSLAHFAFLSGVLAWGISETNNIQSPRSPFNAGGTGRMRAVHIHLEFFASVLHGIIPLRCEQTTWKSYIVGFSAFLVTFAPSWISETKVDTLKRLAAGLRLWHEHDLAIALLEKGGPTSINAAAEFILGY